MEKIIGGVTQKKGINKNWGVLNYDFNTEKNISVFYYDNMAECLMFYGREQEYMITNEGDHTLLHRYIERIFNDYVYRHRKKNVVLVDGDSCLTINKVGSNYLLSYVSSKDNVNYFNLRALKQNDYVAISNFLVFLYNFECQIEFKNTKSL